MNRIGFLKSNKIGEERIAVFPNDLKKIMLIIITYILKKDTEKKLIFQTKSILKLDAILYLETKYLNVMLFVMSNSEMLII